MFNAFRDAASGQPSNLRASEVVDNTVEGRSRRARLQWLSRVKLDKPARYAGLSRKNTASDREVRYFLGDLERYLQVTDCPE